MSRVTWREVASDLAHRLEYQAALAGSAVSEFSELNTTGCSHSLAEADPDRCPFCDDRRAYLRWQRFEARAQALSRKRAETAKRFR